MSISLFLIVVSLLSGLINNTAVVAIFIPFVIDICQRYHISPSKLLLPLSYAAIFGGTLTLIGTSTNLLVNSIIENTPGKEHLVFGMFEFTKLGLIFLAVGTLYNIVVARWLIPSRAIVSSLTQKYQISKYVTEYKVDKKSSLIGLAFKNIKNDIDYSAGIMKILRSGISIKNPESATIEQDDVLIVNINADNILKFKSQFNLLILPDVKMSQQELEGDNHILVEAIITQNSNLIGKTLSDSNFRNIFSSFVLAIKRQTELLRNKVSNIKLKFSDTLLIMIPREKLHKIKDSFDFIVLEELNIHLNYHRYWWLSVLVIPAVMVLTTFGWLPIHVASVFGCAILLICRTITVDDAFESINLSVIFLIAALIPLGLSIQHTGLDDKIASFFLLIESMLPDSPSTQYIFLAIFYLVTFLSTAFLSNAVVAIILTPISFLIADGIGCNPQPFLMAICFGASACFMTPMGYQTNLMVFGPGQYRMKDFVYIGLPLNVIFWVLAIYLIPQFWSFELPQ